jgi:DNA-directed RNA polymerase specialized sigma24 family protein
MPPAGEVTSWFGLLQAGDASAAQALWDRYFPQLVRLARSRLSGVPCRSADEEDVALSAFASFVRGAEAGRFPRLADRTELWNLLVVITARKAAALKMRQLRQRRGGGKVRGDSAFLGPDAADGQDRQGIENVIGAAPTPDFAAQVAEEYRLLLAGLDDDVLRSVAVWKLEGYTNEEIAGKLDCSVATVERRLRRIRGAWEAAGLRAADEVES